MATIKHTRSIVAGNKPVHTDMEVGELFLNTADGIVFLKKHNDQKIFELHANPTGYRNITVTENIAAIPAFNTFRERFKINLDAHTMLNIDAIANIPEGHGGTLWVFQMGSYALEIPTGIKVAIGDYSGGRFVLAPVTVIDFVRMDETLYFKITAKYN